jgi:hypothetical protein
VETQSGSGPPVGVTRKISKPWTEGNSAALSFSGLLGMGTAVRVFEDLVIDSQIRPNVRIKRKHGRSAHI